MSENLKPNLIAQNLPVLQILEPTLVAVPAIETSWEKYPLYLEVKKRSIRKHCKWRFTCIARGRYSLGRKQKGFYKA